MSNNETLKVFNLISDEELYFDINTAPEYAVRYAYCTEQRPELATWFFFSCAQGNCQAEIEARLPIVRGTVSIACGDWACLIGEAKLRSPSMETALMLIVRVSVLRMRARGGTR